MLKKYILDKADQLSEQSTQHVLALHGRQEFKGIVTELVKGFFNSESSKQLVQLRAVADQEKTALTLPSTPASANQNWFQRNRNSLLAVGVGLVAVISLVLILSGVLAPLGIALAAGTATAVALAGTATAAAITIGAGAKIVNDEIEFSGDMQGFTEQNKAYEEKKTGIDAQLKDKIEQLYIAADSKVATFLTAKFENETTPSTKALLENSDVELTSVAQVEQQSELMPLVMEANGLLEQLDKQLKISELAVKNGESVVVRAPSFDSETSNKAKRVASQVELEDKAADETLDEVQRVLK
ncbi:hypothetical protein TUM19329_18330 [Legionella antarctica]|uniref:Uncharacterized protein n=1 Tax=Legionella antarctica TaxID=2708020 RepID=A0A6F8T612_9GAMM|nr:hypothetical protein [Legionella antarctica]BCA95472.1 hypothetical protein TUM19329_18330 [Legionella antarctica]